MITNKKKTGNMCVELKPTNEQIAYLESLLISKQILWNVCKQQYYIICERYNHILNIEEFLQLIDLRDLYIPIYLSNNMIYWIIREVYSELALGISYGYISGITFNNISCRLQNNIISLPILGHSIHPMVQSTSIECVEDYDISNIHSMVIFKDICNRYYANISYYVDGYELDLLSRFEHNEPRIGIDMGTSKYKHMIGVDHTGKVMIGFGYPHEEIDEFYNEINFIKEQRTSTINTKNIKYLYNKINSIKYSFVKKVVYELTNNRRYYTINVEPVPYYISNSFPTRLFLDKLSKEAYRWNIKVNIVSWKPTTQTCSRCGHQLRDEDKLYVTDELYKCKWCNYVENRDINAARNIRDMFPNNNVRPVIFNNE